MFQSLPTDAHPAMGLHSPPQPFPSLCFQTQSLYSFDQWLEDSTPELCNVNDTQETL